MEDWQQYYAAQSPVTDPAEFKKLYDTLPDDIPGLCRVVQGLFLHMHWAEAYGVRLTEEQKKEVRLRKVTRQMVRILELDGSPVTTARPVEKKIVGTCRDYAALMTSFLRHKGVPARMRVGFAAYFTPGHYEDHYLCQYWNGKDRRWVIVDAQLDELQRRVLGITFDPCDLPEGLFLPGGKAWWMCREGRIDPELCGIFNIKGMWFVGCDLIFDAMSLNKIESHPWDIWPLMPQYEQKEFPEEYLKTMDNIATLTGELAPDFAALRSLYREGKRLQPPPGWEP
jgi:Transglutaminase-like superfamily